MQNQRTRTLGQAISEYSLLYALIGIVAIGFLMYLGDVISQGVTGRSLMENASGLFGLIDGNAQGGASASSLAWAGGYDSLPKETITVYMNMDVRNYSYTRADGSQPARYSNNALGGEAELTHMMAQQMDYIAEAYLDANGRPLPQDAAAALTQLAYKAFEISDREQLYLQDQGLMRELANELVLLNEDAGGGDPSDLVENYKEFNQLYQEAEALIESQYPELQPLFENEVKEFAGVVSETTKKFIENRKLDVPETVENTQTHSTQTNEKGEEILVTTGETVTEQLTHRQEDIWQPPQDMTIDAGGIELDIINVDPPPEPSPSGTAGGTQDDADNADETGSGDSVYQQWVELTESLQEVADHMKEKQDEMREQFWEDFKDAADFDDDDGDHQDFDDDDDGNSGPGKAGEKKASDFEDDDDAGRL